MFSHSVCCGPDIYYITLSAHALTDRSESPGLEGKVWESFVLSFPAPVNLSDVARCYTLVRLLLGHANYQIVSEAGCKYPTRWINCSYADTVINRVDLITQCMSACCLPLSQIGPPTASRYRPNTWLSPQWKSRLFSRLHLNFAYHIYNLNEVPIAF